MNATISHASLLKIGSHIAFVSLFWILLCTKIYISSASIHICALVEMFVLGLLSDGDSSLSLSPLLEDESSNEYPKDTLFPFSVSGCFMQNSLVPCVGILKTFILFFD
jgi:hypothetical protein